MNRFTSVIATGLTVLTFAVPSGAAKSVASLYEQQAALWRPAQTFTADIFVTNTDNHHKTYQAGFAKAMKPNFIRMELWDVRKAGDKSRLTEDTPHDIYLSDGKTYWQIDKGGTYTKEPMSADASNLSGFPYPGFFDIKTAPETDSPLRSQEARAENWNGVTYDAADIMIQITTSSGLKIPKQPTSIGKLYFGQDHLVHRVIMGDGTDLYAEYIIRNITLDSPLTKADFVCKLPPFAKTLEVPIDKIGLAGKDSK